MCYVFKAVSVSNLPDLWLLHVACSILLTAEMKSFSFESDTDCGQSLCLPFGPLDYSIVGLNTL